MTAVREDIFAAIETRLRQIAGVAEVERMPSGDPSRFAALHVFDQGHRPSDSGQEAETQHQALGVQVVGFTQGGDGSAAHAELNALYAAVIEVLFAEPVLGGLATEIDENSFAPDVAFLANKRRLAFTLDLTINYATRRGMPQSV